MRLDFKKISYIPGLDGWRALSVMLVMLAHFGFNEVVPGGLGVTIFFFISGFLITTLLIKERNTAGSVSIRDFYIRRFLRLMPELVAMLLITGIYRSAMGDYQSLAEVAAALTYTTNYFIFWVDNFSAGALHPSWPVLWSLSVEEHYYILYPLVFSLFLTTSRRQVIFVVGVALFCLVYRTILVKTGAAFIMSEYPYTYVASEARFDSIVYGVALAYAMQHRPLPISNPIAFVTAGLGGGLLLLSLLIRNPEFRETARYSVQGMGLLLVFAALYNATVWDWVIRIFEVPALKRVGVLSYAAYLWHKEYPYLVEKLAGFSRDDFHGAAKVAYIALGIAFALAVAEISYRFVAKPCQRLRRNFGSHKPA